MKVKICGMRSPENLKAIGALEPDLVGFIFYPGSPRYVGPDFQPNDLTVIPSGIGSVGVFVNEPLAGLLDCQSRFRFRYVQLHGDESPGYCKAVFADGWEIIKAFSIDSKFDFEALKEYEPFCEYFLFDTPAELRGGSGRSFPWELLSRYQLETPFFLAGGLGLSNLAEALAARHKRLAGFDFNSRVEDEPGLKNILKAGTIIQTIRGYATA